MIVVGPVSKEFMNRVRTAVPVVLVVDDYHSSLDDIRVQILQANPC